MAKRTNKAKPKVSKAKPEEGNSYDKIFKENLLELAPAIIRCVLGYREYRIEALPQVKLQTTLEKEPDFFVKIFDERSKTGRILHIEFEGQDEKIMDWRMAEYLGVGGKVHQLEIEQHLIYLGEGSPLNIKGHLEHTHFKFHYKVHCISQLSFQELLYADTPQEVIFAILANPEGNKSEDIIRMILERLIQLTGDSIAIRKFIKQLVMLSKKRNLRDQTINQAINMVGYQDFEDDILYIQGMRKGEEKGLEKGLEEGLEKGLEEGKQEKDITAIRNMFKKNFAPATIAEVLEVPLSYVELILGQLKKELEITIMLRKTNADVQKIAEQLEVNPMLVKVIRQHLNK